MKDPKFEFIYENELYEKERISNAEYDEAPEGQEHLYSGVAKGAGYVYHKIIPFDISDNDLYILSRFVNANNSSKIEKHLKTIKKILIFFAALVGVGIAIQLISLILSASTPLT